MGCDCTSRTPRNMKFKSNIIRRTIILYTRIRDIHRVSVWHNIIHRDIRPEEVGCVHVVYRRRAAVDTVSSGDPHASKGRRRVFDSKLTFFYIYTYIEEYTSMTSAHCVFLIIKNNKKNHFKLILSRETAY